MNRYLPILVLLGVAAGCASAQTHEKVAKENVLQRTQFDLGCENAQVVRLGDVADAGHVKRMSFGVTCGDKKATYVVTCINNWGSVTCNPELNSTQAAKE